MATIEGTWTEYPWKTRENRYKVTPVGDPPHRWCVIDAPNIADETATGLITSSHGTKLEWWPLHNQLLFPMFKGKFLRNSTVVEWQTAPNEYFYWGRSDDKQACLLALSKAPRSPWIGTFEVALASMFSPCGSLPPRFEQTFEKRPTPDWGGPDSQGIFVLRDLGQEAIVGRYRGKLLTRIQAERIPENMYLLDLHDGTDQFIDSAIWNARDPGAGAWTRFINGPLAVEALIVASLSDDYVALTTGNKDSRYSIPRLFLKEVGGKKQREEDLVPGNSVLAPQVVSGLVVAINRIAQRMEVKKTLSRRLQKNVPWNRVFAVNTNRRTDFSRLKIGDVVHFFAVPANVCFERLGNGVYVRTLRPLRAGDQLLADYTVLSQPGQHSCVLGRPAGEPILETQTTKRQCPLCPEKLRSYRSLRAHTDAKHGERISVPPAPADVPSSSSPEEIFSRRPVEESSTAPAGYGLLNYFCSFLEICVENELFYLFF